MNTTTAGYALICFDGLSLLIDQHTIVCLNDMGMLQSETYTEKTSEAIIEETACKVHSLTAHLTVAEKIDTRCRYIVILQTGGHHFGITVNSVQSLPTQNPILHSLPTCMSISGSPIHAYIQIKENIAFCCDVGTLWCYINSPERRHELKT